MGPANRPTSAGDDCEPTGEMSKSFCTERDTQDTAFFLRRLAIQMTAANNVQVYQTGLPRSEGPGSWPTLPYRDDGVSDVSGALQPEVSDIGFYDCRFCGAGMKEASVPMTSCLSHSVEGVGDGRSAGDALRVQPAILQLVLTRCGSLGGGRSLVACKRKAPSTADVSNVMWASRQTCHSVEYVLTEMLH